MLPSSFPLALQGVLWFGEISSYLSRGCSQYLDSIPQALLLRNLSLPEVGPVGKVHVPRTSLALPCALKSCHLLGDPDWARLTLALASLRESGMRYSPESH